MQAIQFKTIVHDEGTIKIPECYRVILQGEIQLIVLFQDNLKKKWHYKPLLNLLH
ncbi:MAG: hypothetical protein RIT27_1314 [Pseudomonadota bacterium]